jgi:uncharacterized repeat protein (TIGR01451 family)
MNTLILAAMLAGAPPSPPSQFAPALYLRVVAPDGVRVTLRPGTPAARTFTEPVAFGVRPGYVARFRLEGLPEEPSLAIDPSIEVRSSLFLPVVLKPEEFPATLTLTIDDVRVIVGGGMVTKVIYLENPDLAPPDASTPDQPLERDVVRGEDPIEEARKRGRILAIVRLGGLALSPAELAAQDITGVVHVPGEPLSPPAGPPMLPARNFQLFDPIAGPRVPMEELLQDGGDVGPRLGVGPGGVIGNLDPTDTGVAYTANGRRRATVSNRVCLVAPRFPVLRQELTPAGYNIALPPITAGSATGLALHRTHAETLHHEAVRAPAQVRTFLVLRGTETRVGPQAVDMTVGLGIVASVQGLAVRGAVIEPVALTQYRDQCKPNEPLVLVKTFDPREARPGDVVTVTIKYINYGSHPARDIVVADSLASRLEYLPGSSRGDRPTVFTLQPNEAGSAALRWQVAAELPPGQSGLIQFQVRVR